MLRQFLDQDPQPGRLRPPRGPVRAILRRVLSHRAPPVGCGHRLFRIPLARVAAPGRGRPDPGPDPGPERGAHPADLGHAHAGGGRVQLHPRIHRLQVRPRAEGRSLDHRPDPADTNPLSAAQGAVPAQPGGIPAEPLPPPTRARVLRGALPVRGHGLAGDQLRARVVFPGGGHVGPARALRLSLVRLPALRGPGLRGGPAGLPPVRPMHLHERGRAAEHPGPLRRLDHAGGPVGGVLLRSGGAARPLREHPGRLDDRPRPPLRRSPAPGQAGRRTGPALRGDYPDSAAGSSP